MADGPTLSTLPDVVLCEIFLWAIILADGRLKVSEAPINLSWTCRSLRAFALSQGRFWAHINLSSDSHEPSPLVWSSMWLERSGNAPLDIVIAEIELCWSSQERIDSFHRLISTHPRWKRLRLNNYTRSASKEFKWPVDDLSQLRELEAKHFNADFKGTPNSILMDDFIKLPKITKSQTPIAPRLVHLHVEYVGASKIDNGFSAMLDHCPALECIHVGNPLKHVWPLRGAARNLGSGGTGTRCLSRLSRIGIGDYHAFGWLAEFGPEHAPALETLEVHSPDAKKFADALISSRVGPLVRRASLRFSLAWHSESAEVDRIYQALTNVTHLLLDFQRVDLDLASLSFEASGHRRFPELEYFKFVADHETNTKRLESMLASRMLHSSQFKAEIETSSWTVQRSKKFLARKKIKAWIRSGRLEVSGVDKAPPKPPPKPSKWRRPPVAAMPLGWAEAHGFSE